MVRKSWAALAVYTVLAFTFSLPSQLPAQTAAQAAFAKLHSGKILPGSLAQVSGTKNPAPLPSSTSSRGKKKSSTPDASDPLFVLNGPFDSNGVIAQGVAVIDINRDGIPDLAVLNQCTNDYSGCPHQQEFPQFSQIGFLTGNGDGTFSEDGGQSTFGYSYPSIPSSIVAADLEGDGIPDLIVTNQCGDDPTCSSEGTVSVLFDGVSAPRTYLTGGYGPYSVAVADLNGDGYPDLVIANACDSSCTFGEVAVLLGNGDGTFQDAQTFDAGNLNPFSVVLADVDGDGKLDAIVATSNCPDFDCTDAPGSVGILRGNGDGTFQSAVSFSSLGLAPDAIAAKDLNGDGKVDIVVANQCSADGCTDRSSTLVVFLGNGDGTFQSGTTYDGGGYLPSSVAVVDINGDGKLDLVTTTQCGADPACQRSGNVGILFGNGDGTFQPVQPYVTLGQQSVAAAFGDFNKDGALDIAVANACSTCGLGEVSILLRNTTTTTFTANPSSTSYGTALTLTAAVAGIQGTPSGTVTITDGASTLATLTLAAGVVTLATDNLPVGTHLFTATYSGDSTFPGSASQPISVTVAKASPVCTLSSSLNPSLTVQGITFSNGLGVSVPADAIGPSGTINFYDGSTLIGSTSVSSQTGAISFPGFAAGSHPISVSYLGDANFNGCTSLTLTQQVNKVSTQTALSSSSNPSLAGQSLTLTATITPGYPGSPSGSVIFYDKGVQLGSVIVTGSVAAFTTSSLAPGNHSLTASYSGDSNFLGSSSNTLAQGIQQATVMSLVSSLNPSIYGQQVIFTATVTAVGATPPGTVTFMANNKFLGTVKLIGGTAILGASNLNPGSTAVVATYTGNSLFHTSTATVVQVVNGIPTTSTITGSSSNPSVYGQTVTFTATVTSSNGTPTGTVHFKTGGTSLGQAALVNGVATLTTTPAQLPGGADSVIVTYAANAQFAGSSSPAFFQTVTQTVSTTSLASSANPSSLGQTVTITATVSGAYVTPKGNVRFFDGTKLLAVIPLSSGSALYTTSVLTGGTHSISALYVGDLNYASSSTTMQQNVQQP